MDKGVIQAIISTLEGLDIKATRENTNRLEAVYQTLEKEMAEGDHLEDQNKQREGT